MSEEQQQNEARQEEVRADIEHAMRVDPGEGEYRVTITVNDLRRCTSHESGALVTIGAEWINVVGVGAAGLRSDGDNRCRDDLPDTWETATRVACEQVVRRIERTEQFMRKLAPGP